MNGLGTYYRKRRTWEPLEQGQNVVVELPPGGITTPQGSHHNNEAHSESFTMISQMNDLAVQSQAESSMSSYVHVPSLHNTNANASLSEWSVGETSTLDLARNAASLAMIKVHEDMMIMPRDDRKNIARQLREDMKRLRHGSKKQKLENHHHDNNSSFDNDTSSTSLSMIQEFEDNTDEDLSFDLNYPIDGSALDFRMVHNKSQMRRRRSSGTSEQIANTLVTILMETTEVDSLKVVKDLEDLRSDLVEFFTQAKNERTTRCCCFIGFKIANQNQFEEIQSNGFDCGRPGFHLCKTIENAKSFRQFEKNSSSSSEQEHLWVVLGTEPPRSGNPNATDCESQALPLACVDLQSTSDNNSNNGLNALVSDLQKWAKNVS